MSPRISASSRSTSARICSVTARSSAGRRRLACHASSERRAAGSAPVSNQSTAVAAATTARSGEMTGRASIGGCEPWAGQRSSSCAWRPRRWWSRRQRRSSAVSDAPTTPNVAPRRRRSRLRPADRRACSGRAASRRPRRLGVRRDRNVLCRRRRRRHGVHREQRLGSHPPRLAPGAPGASRDRQRRRASRARRARAARTSSSRWMSSTSACEIAGCKMSSLRLASSEARPACLGHAATPMRRTPVPGCGEPHACGRTGDADSLRAEKAQDREHAPVVLGGSGKSQLDEDARDVLLDGAGRDEELLPDCLVGAPLCHQLEHLALAGG